MCPFQALYRYSPLNREIVTQEVSPVVVVEDMLLARVNMDHIFHKQLQLATNIIKQIADKRRMKREFHVGDLVYLESQSYR